MPAPLPPSGRRAPAPPNLSGLSSLHPSMLAPLMAAAAPAQSRAIASMPPAQLSQLAQSVAAIAPAVATAVAAPSSSSANDTAQRVAASLPMGSTAMAVAAGLIATGQYAKWGTTGAANPISAVGRRRPQPIKLLPASVVVNSAGVGQLTFTPQEPFEGFRLCVPSGQGAAANTAGYLSQLTAGDRLMVAQSGRIPLNVLRENSDVGRIDFPLISLGETVTAQLSGCAANAEIGAVIIGYATRPRVLPDGAEILYQRWEPFDVTADPGSGTSGGVATISLAPQRHCIIRRLAFDDSITGFTSVYMTSLNVQDNPQFTANVELPLQLFGELAVDDWLDFDMCQLGGQINIGLRNAGANSVNIQGMAEVDIVRLPGEPVR